jgi:ATP-dependent helicase/nuclease subunit B
VANVIDALEARQWEKPVVFVGGLLEKEFPRQGREDIFLKDSERRKLKSLTGINLQEVLKRTHEEERFLFYVALTRARNKLILSYPASDSQGRPTIPCFYLDDLRNLFTPESYSKVFQKRNPINFIPKPHEVLVEKDLRNFLFYYLTSSYTVGTEQKSSPGAESGQGQILQGGHAVPLHYVARAVYNRELSRKSAWLEGLRVVLARPDKAPQPEGLLKEMLSSFSATQLSDYAQCPFLHFCRWILKIKPMTNRAEEGLSPILQGEIVHKTLKLYYETIFEGGAANLEDIFQKTFKEKTSYIPHRFQEQKLKKEMLHALMEFAEQDRAYIEGLQLQPRYLEVSFGREEEGDPPAGRAGGFIAYEGAQTPASLGPLKLKDKNGTTVIVTGRIDRIDVGEVEGESLGLVIDYKYSKEIKEKEIVKDLLEGTDLQLPIYVLAARDLLGLKPVGAQFYTLKPQGRSGIVTFRLANKGEPITKEELERTLESCKGHVFRQVEGILAGDRRVNPKDIKHCQQQCEYRDVCRFEGARPKIDEE